MSVFKTWQPLYAERGIATFPIGAEKRPKIRGWNKIGLKGSNELASKFTEAEAFGYVTGRRSKVTILDVDTADEKVLSDAMVRHGQADIVVRTASGKFHGLFRYAGERRRIRPWPGLPIDVLGDNGFAIAAPSKLAKGSYEIIHGHLDDLDRLKPMAEPPTEVERPKGSGGPVQQGTRNDALWRHSMIHAKECDTLDVLLDVGRTFNESCCQPPLPDDEVMKVANSAWSYTARGRNWFGGTFFQAEEVASLLKDQDALVLLIFLRANNGPRSEFMCTNTLSEKFNWDRERLAAARKRLIALGYMKMIRKAYTGSPALFAWKQPKLAINQKFS